MKGLQGLAKHTETPVSYAYHSATVQRGMETALLYSDIDFLLSQSRF